MFFKKKSVLEKELDILYKRIESIGVVSNYYDTYTIEIDEYKIVIYSCWYPKYNSYYILTITFINNGQKIIFDMDDIITNDKKCNVAVLLHKFFDRIINLYKQRQNPRVNRTPELIQLIKTINNGKI